MTTVQKKPILVFDWDGVIADSNDWKWDGMWHKIFPSALSLIARNLLKAKEGRSLTRYELIRRILLQGGLVELAAYDENSAMAHPSVAEALERFQTVSREGVIKKGLFNGAREVLSDLSAQGYSLYVITGTAHDDIVYLTEKLNVGLFFKQVYGITHKGFGEGGAINKSYAFEKIAEIEDTKDPRSYVVIGDGETDYNLAQKIRCRFIGVANKWNNWENTPFPLIKDLTELPSCLKTIESK